MYAKLRILLTILAIMAFASTARAQVAVTANLRDLGSQ